MYRTVVTICTAQWSLYVPQSGHYMYRTVVTICTAQWSLYVPHGGHYMYHQFNIHISTFSPLTVFMCFVWISEQTAIISLYNINWLVFVTQTEIVYCAVRTVYFCTIQFNLAVGMLNEAHCCLCANLPLFKSHVPLLLHKHSSLYISWSTSLFFTLPLI